jgi:hypothetical protein
VRLVEKHFDEFRVFRELGVKSLDRDRARKAHGAAQSTHVNGRHSPGGDLGKHRVPANQSDGLS